MALGLTAEQFTGLSGAFARFGIDAQGTVDVLSDVSDWVQDAAVHGGELQEVFTDIGLSANDLMGLRPDQQFKAIAEALSKLDPTLAAGLAARLGGDFQKLLPLLRQGVAGVEAMAAKFAMSAADVEEARKANEAYRDATGSITRVWRQVVRSSTNRTATSRSSKPLLTGHQMPTAPHLNDLADRFTPLALAVAGGFARTRPSLRDEFASASGWALFRVLSSPQASAPGTNLGALVRVAVRNACLTTIRREAIRAAVQLAEGTDEAGTERDPLALIPGREPEPGAELEVVEEVEVLLARAHLTEQQHERLVRHFFAGAERKEVAAEHGVSGKAVSQSIGAALVKLRAAADG